MEVTYVDHMGSDLTVVNAARVSFDNESTKLITKDRKLIRYLAMNEHWSPFAHPQISLRVDAPVFVARQLAKHQVGFAWNEVSRRYVSDDTEFYFPEKWRKKSDDIKQGSTDEEVDIDVFKLVKNGQILTENFSPYWTERCIPKPIDRNDLSEDDLADYDARIEAWDEADVVPADNPIETLTYIMEEMYDNLLALGVCPEQARMILPQSMYTSWIWTGSLLAFSRMCKLRLDSHAQRETQEVAKQISDIIEPLFPESWGKLLSDWNKKEIDRLDDELDGSYTQRQWDRSVGWGRVPKEYSDD